MSNIKNKINFFENLNSKNTTQKDNLKKNKKLNSEISYWNNITNNNTIITSEKKKTSDNSVILEKQEITNNKINTNTNYDEEEELLNANSIMN